MIVPGIGWKPIDGVDRDAQALLSRDEPNACPPLMPSSCYLSLG